MRDDEHVPPVTALAAAFERQADPARGPADIATLAAGPRGRHHPQALARAQGYVTDQLTEAGWLVTAAPFERRWVLGVTDAGGRASILRRLRLHRRLSGINLLAERPGRP